ncbi:MAG: hypothetical protein AB7R90_05750 [Reyranellaceae bacterium]
MRLFLAAIVLLLTIASAEAQPRSGPTSVEMLPPDAATLKTPAGTLATRACDKAQCVQLDGQTIAGDFSVALHSAWPSREKPQLVFYSTHAGGNCCLPALHALDVTRKPAFDLGPLFVDREERPVRVVRDGATLVLSGDAGERNRLGDPVLTTFVYDSRDNGIRIPPDPGVPDFAAMIGEHPDTLLGSPDHRAALVGLWGEDLFVDLRHALSVASGMELLAHRYLIAEGCRPHSCGVNQALLAIDLRSGRSIGVIQDTHYADDGKRESIDLAMRTDFAPRALPPELRAKLESWLKPTGAKLVLQRDRLRLDNPRNPADDTTR